MILFTCGHKKQTDIRRGTKNEHEDQRRNGESSEELKLKDLGLLDPT